MTLGVRDLKNISLPAAWDGNELARRNLRDGTTYEAIVRDLDSGLSIVNANLASGYLGRLTSLTLEDAIEYRSGVGGAFEDHTEQTQPDRQYAETNGHMLPLKMIDRAMGWTADYLKKARRIQIDSDINDMIDAAINGYEKRVWTRLFKLEEETGKANGLGATGVSVPFADGGVGTIDFIPPANPARMINAFDATHNHFLRLNGITQANLETAVAHLWEHGVDGPYELIVSQADLGAWQNVTNVTGYRPKAQALIAYNGAQDIALVDADMYQGAVITEKGTLQIYSNGRIPTGYWGVTKSYGQNAGSNPLKVRYDEIEGFGVKLVVNQVTLYPFQAAIGQFEFGVGVGEDRVGAVLVEDDSTGTYATPTIS